VLLFIGSRNWLNHPMTGGYSPLRPVLTIMVLPALNGLNGATAPLNVSPSVRSRTCVAACTSVVPEF
jgi:hypothetical protein